MAEVKVINHNEETLYGRFDGEDYEFVPEQATYLSFDAASHIFGLGKDDKSQALNQLGWLVPGRLDLAAALAKLDRITFMAGKTVFDDGSEAPAEPDAETAEQAPRSKRRTGGRPHVTGPGGESAAEVSSASAAANPS